MIALKKTQLLTVLLLLSHPSPCRWQKLHPDRNRWAYKPFPGILCRMIRWLSVLLLLAVAGLKSRRNLLLENLALRHQLLILSRGFVALPQLSSEWLAKRSGHG